MLVLALSFHTDRHVRTGPSETGSAVDRITYENMGCRSNITPIGSLSKPLSSFVYFHTVYGAFCHGIGHAFQFNLNYFGIRRYVRISGGLSNNGLN